MSEPNHLDNLELESDGVLYFDDGSIWEITSFDKDEDRINARRLDDDHNRTDETESWTAGSVESALIQDECWDGEGRSHELVKSF